MRAARILGTVGAAALAASTLMALPARAVVLACGQTVTTSVQLTADVGPCANNGLIAGADNITIDLNGHRVFGTAAKGDGAGVLLQGRTNVTVKNGTVDLFDAGVAIVGGTYNTVTLITAKDNIGGTGASYGDGIAIASSTANRILSNVVRNNGPYSGIGLFSLVDSDHPRSVSGNSTGNLISGNTVDANVASRDGDPTHTDNDGIRVENKSTGNTISGNTVSNNGLDGISLFREAGGNRVLNNTVFGNGFFRTTARRGSGIIVFNLANGNVIETNTVYNNADNGIVLRGPVPTAAGSTGNRVRNNTAYDNAALPTIPSATFGNAAYDLHDQNANCSGNQWYGNKYKTANPACTTVGGSVIP